MSFLIRKRKNVKVVSKHQPSGESKLKALVKKSKKDTAEVSSGSEDEDGGRQNGEIYFEQTDHDKKLREAKLHLAEIEAEQRRKQADGEELIDREAIGARLRQDTLEKSGQTHKQLADGVVIPTVDRIKHLRGHRLPATCCCLSSDGGIAFSGSKDGSIIKWDVSKMKKIALIKGLDTRQSKPTASTAGHSGQVLCMALSQNGKYLCTSGTDKYINIWLAEDMSLVKQFNGHRGTVYSLAINLSTNVLFSSSADKTVKLWNLNELGYMETLYGHQDPVLSVDCYIKERAITVGGTDRTVRMWKLEENSHLVFEVPSSDCCGSLENISMFNDTTFATGSNDSALRLWSTNRKKPIQRITNAHSIPGSDVTCWISALRTIRGSDLLASGSCDGYIRLWRCVDGKRLESVGVLPVKGFVNDLAISSDARFLIAAVAQEHKWGRWWREPAARNGIALIPLCEQQSTEGNEQPGCAVS